MLLTASENGSGSKNDVLPSNWRKCRSKEYLTLHWIISNKKLWAAGGYEDFIESNKALIQEKLKNVS